MKHRLSVLTTCSAMLMASATMATDPPAPSLPGHAGDSWSYKVEVTFTNLSNNAVVSLKDGLLTRTVLESKSKDRLLVQELAKDFVVPRGVIPPKSYLSTSISFFADGRADKIVEGACPAAYRLINLATLKLPSEGLKVGLHWSWKADADSTKGTPAVSADYTVLEDGVYEGIPGWKIEFSSRELGEFSNREVGEFNSPKMGGTIWLRKSDLVQLGVDEVGEFLPVPGTDDLVKRKITTYFIPESETHAAVPRATTSPAP